MSKIRHRPKTKRKQCKARKRRAGRVKTRTRAPRRVKRMIKRMKHAPRLFLEDKVGRLVFRLVTRGEGLKDTTVVKLRCTAEFRLDACIAMSSEDKTWDACLIGLKQNL